MTNIDAAVADDAKLTRRDPDFIQPFNICEVDLDNRVVVVEFRPDFLKLLTGLARQASEGLGAVSSQRLLGVFSAQAFKAAQGASHERPVESLVDSTGRYIADVVFQNDEEKRLR